MYFRHFRFKLTGIIILLCSFTATAQISDDEYYNRLYHTCKVWGYMKYFHTRIAGGYVSWDDILVKSINSIKTAAGNEAFNDSLLVMIKQAGEMGSSGNSLPEVVDSLNNNLDTGWLKDAIFSDAVKAELENVRVKFRPRNNVYIASSASSAPSFEIDNRYHSESNFPDENKRILSLFRYWNIINYFYPYKSIMDQKWDLTLKEFIPAIVSAEDSLDYHLNFKILTTRINDSHASFNSPVYYKWSGTASPPFLIRHIQGETVITKLLPSATQLSVGDIIKKIDDTDIYKLRDSLRKFVNGSNDAVIERNLNDMILLGNTGEFSLTVSNGSGEKTITLSRNYDNYKALNVVNNPAWQKKMVTKGCNFGLVNMGILKPEEVQTMFRELWETDAIIFDIRNYPLGTLWTIVNYLFEAPLHIANFTVPDITYPGRLTWHKETIGNGTSKPYKGNIIILFDERTQSQAEYTCMGLGQFPGSVRIGSTTAAADGNVAIIHLPGRISTYATFLGTYYPDFTATQRVGIIPDIEVKPTIEGIRNGRDEVLEAALDCRIANDIISIYPNPVTDILHFNSIQWKTLKFEIYDTMGRKLHSGYSASGDIDVSFLAGGIYLVKVITDRFVVTKKIIKSE
ncbi:MAG: T9SS type A sorting domain-containing protein [Chloroflexota bacterium]